MGKNDFLTPKAIANRIKAKGLQKLRWYCQLCQKQCRDENGFKCHQTSESHRRQMEVFGMNPKRIVEGYSQEFEATFLAHLRRAYPNARVLAKNVYNEFITDRHHIHMTSTKWLTLSEFVKYLGREGKCKVEETDKGWYITYIKEDVDEKLAKERHQKRATHEKEEEERLQAALRAQVKRAREMAEQAGRLPDDGAEAAEASVLALEEREEPVVLSLQAGGSRPPVAHEPLPAAEARGAIAAFGEDDDDNTPSTSAAGAGPRAKKSKVQELMEKELRAKASAASSSTRPPPVPIQPKGRVDHWLHPGIVVKVMSKALKEHGYYKQKGVVERVVDKYIGEVSMLGSGDVIRVDQAELESVVPSPGGLVLIVNGTYRVSEAELLEIDTTKFRALLRVTRGPYKGVETWQEYEDFCKLSSS